MKNEYREEERIDCGGRGERSRSGLTSSECTAKSFEGIITEKPARYREKEEIKRIWHNEGMVAGEYDARRAMGIESRVGELECNCQQSAKTSSPEIDREGVRSSFFF